MARAQSFRIPRLDGALIRQLVVYTLVGAFLAGLSTAGYLVPIFLFGAPPLLANLIAYVLAVCAGFQLHLRLTFAAAGRSGAPALRAGRFLAVSLVSLGLNSLFVWVLTSELRLSPLWPLVPMLLVTPLASFWLNRRWVFG
jgi:putative flippase GtrA